MTSNNPVALITAGGSGIGAAIARKLASANYRVAILSPSGKGEALADKLGGFGLTGSNRKIEDLRRFVRGTLDVFGRIDAVVNSAGHGPRGALLDITDQEWHDALDTYMLNVVRVARLTSTHMVENGGGAIVNISSYATFEPDAGFPTSSAMRAALAAFTKLFSDDFAKRNVRMNNVLPGFVDSYPEDPAIVDRIPMGRYATTEEIAETVAFLVSPGAAYITGQNIRVDGGLTRSV